MTKVVYLFPDTNVYLQCLPLDQVDWSLVGAFTEVELVIARPVQAEIDSFKGKGNARQAQRARTVSSLVRKMLEAPEHRILLREASPVVHARLAPDLRPDRDLVDELDYSARDDQLVGSISRYQKQFPELDVRLLAHDTGPMASATTVGVPYIAIPDNWLLAPESDDAGKREANLQAELERFRKQEPKFEIAFDQKVGKRLEANLIKYEELTPQEVEMLLERLRTKHPLVAVSGKAAAPQKGSAGSSMKSLLLGDTEVFIPATQEEIDAYPSRYEAWLEDCRKRLSNLADALQRQLSWPRIGVSVANTGSRPALHALVELEVRGSLLLRPLGDEADVQTKLSDIELGLTLSRPPRPPQGRWVKPLAGRANLLQSAGLYTPRLPDLNFFPPPVRDPNAVYFKVGSVGVPRQRIELECDQWRHAQSAQTFSFEVLSKLAPGVHRGLIQLTAHASNLTEPGRESLPVAIQVTPTSCLAVAEQLIDELQGPASGLRLAI